MEEEQAKSSGKSWELIVIILIAVFAISRIELGATEPIPISEDLILHAQSLQKIDNVNLIPDFSTTTSYKDEKYNFQLKYPKGMILAVSPSGRLGTGINYSIGMPDEKWSYSIDVKPNTTNQSLQSAFQENYDYWKSNIGQYTEFQLKDLVTSDIVVGGQKAKELFINNFGDTGSTMVSVVANGNSYIISGGVRKGDLDQFLSTISFNK